ncbi:MAG: cytochrome c oxidase subunit 3 [Cyanobacteria bacterium REEB65]|nr:cytochrome c oxidase subunit 3 [Cyanobacteria bacterium REEB65]
MSSFSMPQNPIGWPQGAPKAPRRAPSVPHGVVAMVMVIAVEIMLFAGLISAFLFASAAHGTLWPPKGEPPLPVFATGINTLVLLVSGIFLWLSGRQYAERPKASQNMLGIGTLLGATFLAVQGGEWLKLLHEGMTLASTTHASYVYLLIGMHAVHVCVALLALVWANVRLRGQLLAGSTFWVVRLFWYFVVAVWPILYLLVYVRS